MMRALEVSRKEAAEFLKLFEKVDTDYSGTIDMYEYFQFMKVEVTEWATVWLHHSISLTPPTPHQ